MPLSSVFTHAQKTISLRRGYFRARKIKDKTASPFAATTHASC
jgi:hypothetical protein